MKVGVIGAGTMGSGIVFRHSHRQKDTKYTYVILTMNLPQTVKRKSLKDLKRE